MPVSPAAPTWRWHLWHPLPRIKLSRSMPDASDWPARSATCLSPGTYALHHTGWLYQYCLLGLEAAARRAAGEEITLATEQGFLLWYATGTFFLRVPGCCSRMPPDEALPLLRKGLDAFRATGAELTLPFQLVHASAAYTQIGRFEDARKAPSTKGLAIADEKRRALPGCQTLHRLQGQLLLAESLDQVDAAVDCFQLAIETGAVPRAKGGSCAPR